MLCLEPRGQRFNEAGFYECIDVVILNQNACVVDEEKLEKQSNPKLMNLLVEKLTLKYFCLKESSSEL